MFSVLIISLIKKCKQQLTGKHGMIEFNTVYKLITTSAVTQMAPLSRPFTIMWGKKIYMSFLATTHIQFLITPEDKFWYQLILNQ